MTVEPYCIYRTGFIYRTVRHALLAALACAAAFPAQALDGAAPDEDDRSSGFTVSAQLNANFNDVRRECPGGKAPPFCNGVIIRAVRAETGTWNPNANAVAKNGVSTSYLRADAHFYTPYRPIGLVFHPLDTTGTPLYALKPRCVYPPDGNLHLRSEACGPADLRSTQIGGPCELHGIDTVAKWLDYYALHGTAGQCSLAVTVDAFEIALQVRQTFARPPVLPEGWYEGRNELVIEPWPQDIPAALPLAAIYYTGNEVADAQFIQLDYYAATGRVLPVLRLTDPVPLSGLIFSYRKEDQAKQVFENRQSGQLRGTASTR